MERAAERERLAQEKETLPLAELEARGLVLLDVESTESSVGLGGRHIVTFVRDGQRAIGAKLGSGDLVTVAPRKAAIENPPRGIVVMSSRTQVQVAFDLPPPDWVSEGRLRIDISPNDVTWQRANAALDACAAMSTGVKRDRREILLGNVPPRFERLADFTPSRPLNPEQLDAVKLALSARDFALVHGPPGTGKSTVLGEIAVQAARAGKKILCTAASNAAVDHLLELSLDAGLDAVRVGHPARVLPHLQSHTVDLLVEAHDDRIAAKDMFEEAFDLLGYARRQRTQGRSRQRFSNAREAQSEGKKLISEAKRLERRAVASILDRAQVICATCTMLEGTLLEHREFDLVLLDEATQATEPTALMAFLKAPATILAGDPQQLAPTIMSTEAKAGGLGVSLFERLLGDHGDNVKRMLKEQYRMNEQIMNFPSREMYQGQLRAHESVKVRVLSDVLQTSTSVDAPPVLFLDTAGRGYDEVTAAGSASLRNEGEAALVVAHARRLLAAGLDAHELALISPYRAQAEWLRELMAEVPEIEIDTIDAFQGREKEAILVSLVRCNTEQTLGFLNDLRRMNVAMTRPRRHLFVVGDSATLSSSDFYRRFIDDAQALGGYRSVWEWEAAFPDGVEPLGNTM